MSTSAAPGYAPTKISATESNDGTAVGHPSTSKGVDAPIRVQPTKQADMQPSYAQEFTVDAPNYGWYGSMIDTIGSVMGGLGSIPCCFCCPNPYKSVHQGSVGLVTKFGQLTRSVNPGLVQLNPLSESLKTVDIKIQIAGIPRQEVMTRDNVSVGIDSVLVYHIVNPSKATFGVSDVRVALVERAQTTLRHVVGSRTLQSVLTDREAVAAEIENIVEGVASTWGVAVESILIKDIAFSRELQESLSSAAQQKRIGEAKVIAAQAEVDSARLFREAADILSSPAALQIRQIEGMIQMASKANSKVIFVPMNTGGMEAVSGATQFNQLEQLANQQQQ